MKSFKENLLNSVHVDKIYYNIIFSIYINKFKVLINISDFIVKMGNKSSIEIVIRTDKNFYYPGETVNSTIYLNCPKPIPCSKLVVQIIGF